MPGHGPLPHRHPREEETFYVLDGEFDFAIDGSHTSASTGTAVHVPAGVVHAFKNTGDEPARLLIQTSPAGLEKLITGYGQPVTDCRPPESMSNEDGHRVLTIAQKYGVQVVPHPPASTPESAGAAP